MRYNVVDEYFSTGLHTPFDFCALYSNKKLMIIGFSHNYMFEVSSCDSVSLLGAGCSFPALRLIG